MVQAGGSEVTGFSWIWAGFTWFLTGFSWTWRSFNSLVPVLFFLLYLRWHGRSSSQVPLSVLRDLKKGSEHDSWWYAQGGHLSSTRALYSLSSFLVPTKSTNHNNVDKPTSHGLIDKTKPFQKMVSRRPDGFRLILDSFVVVGMVSCLILFSDWSLDKLQPH